MTAQLIAVKDDKALLHILIWINPKFASFCEYPGCDIFNLPLISQKTKCLILPAFDVSNQPIDANGASFEAHVDMELQQGASIEEIDELFSCSCHLLMQELISQLVVLLNLIKSSLSFD